MPAEEQLSDDYVASLLAKDAKSSNAKYSVYGLQELLPRRATNNAPKPNTRFLKNIIRETDSHNAALRAKEAADSRARLKELPKGNRGSGSLESSHGRLSREDDRPSKRRRVESDDEARSERRERDGKTKSGRDRVKNSRIRRSDRRDGDDDEDQEERARRRHHRHHDHRGHRRRSEERSLERYERKSRHQKERHMRHRSKSRSRSPHGKYRSHRRRSSSPRSQDAKIHRLKDSESEKNRILPKANREGFTKSAPKRTPSPASDSDPLDSIIGPPPPPPPPKIQARGRGTFASSSAMDSHFSSNYDPSVDVQPDPDIDDDWDMALEALRDRQKWKTQGAERLKAAGFTEEEVQKWEKGGEKGEEDVRWKGRGEGREWDRGKVIGEDGVETVPEWGRLKGT